MRCIAFANRNFKEITRDPLTIIFGAGFPLVLMGLLTIIQNNIPLPLFELERLTPGISIFGLSFIALFSGLLLARDKTSAFLTRLYSSPMKAWEFIAGYTLPLIPLYLLQSILCYIFALILGMNFSLNLLFAILLNFPTAIIFIALGLLSGSIFNDKQVGGIIGALLTNVCAWLSGTWFDLSLMGESFKKIAYLLPFANAVDCGRAALAGKFSEMWGYFSITVIYALTLFIIAVIVFNHKMRKN